MRNQFTRAASLLTYVVFMALSLAACTKKATTSGLQSDSSKTSRGKHTDAIDQMSGNPVLPVPTADPDIIYANGKYYIYTTATGPNASQFHAYSSTDLLNWTDEGIVLDLANVSWAHTDGWAPSVCARNGNYYFYFTAAKKIGVAVSTSPTGPFVDKGEMTIINGNFPHYNLHILHCLHR